MERIRVNAAVFDYGNTIAHDPFDDILRLKSEELHNVLEGFGYNIKRRDIISGWGMANNSIDYPFISHFAQELPITAEALKNIGVKNDDIPELSGKFLSIYRDGYEKIYTANPRRYEVKDTLSCLKEMEKKLAIFSNGRQSDVSTAMKLYGVHDLFDFILSSESLNLEKPNPRVFSTISEMLEELPRDIVYVGDDPLRDIKPSKQAGMKAILYVPPKKYRKAVPWRKYEDIDSKPDAVITKFSQLKNIVI